MKVSASVYSNTKRDLVDLVKELDQFHIDYIHIDCNDDLAVFEDIKKIREISHTPIDLHIISECPNKFFNLIIDNKIELATFQVENLQDDILIPENLQSSIGIAIMTHTDLEIFEKYQHIASFILFMTTIPGQSGGVFAEENFDKIRKFRQKYPNKKIHVDGGVNEEVSFILRNLGVYAAVSGSYLVKSNEIGKSLLHLKSDLKSTHYRVSDFMMKRNELPVVNKDEINLKNILISINNYKLGFCLIVDSEKLCGIVTDGDIRRAILKNLDDLNQLKIDCLVNENPIHILSHMSIFDLLSMLKDAENPITFVPVINENNILVGAISFQNLIKGEL